MRKFSSCVSFYSVTSAKGRKAKYVHSVLVNVFTSFTDRGDPESKSDHEQQLIGY